MRFFRTWLSAMFATWVGRMAAGVSVLLAIGGATAPVLGWTWWPYTSLWIAAGFCIVMASYDIWIAEHKHRISLEAKVSGFPRLRLAPDAIRPESFTIRYGTTSDGRIVIGPTYTALRLRLTNDPPHNTPDSYARGVRASVSFWNPLTGDRLLFVDGRWADSTQPSQRDVNRDITEILAVDFPVGQSRSLDLLIKYPEDEYCYAMNNDSYEVPDLRNNNLRLPKGILRIVVRVQAPYVDCTITAEVANDGERHSVRPLKWDLSDAISVSQAN